MKRLSLKQEKFIRKFMKTRNATEAYEYAYDSENMKIETIHEEACRTLKNRKVSARIEYLEERNERNNDLQVKDILNELEDARKMAEDNKQSSAMTAASKTKGQLLGMFTEKLHIDGNLNIFDAMKAADEPSQDEIDQSGEE